MIMLTAMAIVMFMFLLWRINNDLLVPVWKQWEFTLVSVVRQVRLDPIAPTGFGNGGQYVS